MLNLCQLDLPHHLCCTHYQTLLDFFVDPTFCFQHPRRNGMCRGPRSSCLKSSTASEAAWPKARSLGQLLHALWLKQQQPDLIRQSLALGSQAWQLVPVQRPLVLGAVVPAIWAQIERWGSCQGMLASAGSLGSVCNVYILRSMQTDSVLWASSLFKALMQGHLPGMSCPTHVCVQCVPYSGL